MRRPSLLLAASLLGGPIACSIGSPSTGPNHAIAYAVIYGQVTAPKSTNNIQVYGSAYTDSLKALHADSSGYFGAVQATPFDTANDYQTFIQPTDGNPRTLWVNLTASGQGQRGYVSATDTVRALRVHLDTLGGAPHDSVAANFTLP